MCQCPLGLIPHFYVVSLFGREGSIYWCQCPLGLIPHFYPRVHHSPLLHQCLCQCPLGLIPHFYSKKGFKGMNSDISVNALSGLYLISTKVLPLSTHTRKRSVNALSGLYLISTTVKDSSVRRISHVSMPSRAYTSFLRRCSRSISKCLLSVNALSGLYLISTVPLQKPRFYAVSRACFCRYLSEYSDNSYFSCMLTFWTYLMRCTYP